MEGKLWWLPATYYQIHRKRGSEALDAARVQGTALHDFWKPYFASVCMGCATDLRARAAPTGLGRSDDRLPWISNRRSIRPHRPLTVSLKNRSRHGKPVISRSWRKALLTTRCHRDLPTPSAKKPNLATCSNAWTNTAKKPWPHVRSTSPSITTWSKGTFAATEDFRHSKPAKAFCTIRSYLSRMGAIDALARVFSGDPVPTLDSLQLVPHSGRL